MDNKEKLDKAINHLDENKKITFNVEKNGDEVNKESEGSDEFKEFKKLFHKMPKKFNIVIDNTEL